MENQENQNKQENQNLIPNKETSQKKEWIKPMMEELEISSAGGAYYDGFAGHS